MKYLKKCLILNIVLFFRPPQYLSKMCEKVKKNVGKIKIQAFYEIFNKKFNFNFCAFSQY